MKQIIDGVEVEMTPEQEQAQQALRDSRINIDKMCLRIDAAVAAIYERVGRYSEEYRLREAQATAFRDAGYVGDMPRQVAAFATRAGVSAQFATDLILSQATQMRGALDDLGDLRMRKYEIKRAADKPTAKAAFDEIMAAVKVISESLT